ncbi:flagellar transcriptional regulator FlhC [Erwinia tasmaniensis]|uniref:Flagellar transcriptional regulator FlhC n=1 Tax=Erwinia tasmaniensis (strain DSM 17950 / CFBP 7177 / CIP 109463 / NCPPB 4357 / Et1/99) TaxID=465817 RepID=FLHC_ERWT9|nr:flagellar transcriptional regulator FlhC [Erwinia tasmaniensis]B2VDW1.1 RecName: Full=Flagellar transcriptional regulator FlhC [Erwinia tasmaniensis Et1/99]CAO95997.1 Flagellum biosynthesis transcription activator [Erwinia tasmaniensis Et1/99]
MIGKKVLDEIYEINIAMELIVLGARMQVLESETSVSRRRLVRLYKEIRGCPPPKGMLPFSEDWFMCWEQNIHSSLFYNIYLCLQKTENERPITTLMQAYRLYLEQCYPHSSETPVLGLTRAWTLLRFIGCGMISRKSCMLCAGGFVMVTEFIKEPFTCSLCCPPSRALKKFSATSGSS